MVVVYNLKYDNFHETLFVFFFIDSTAPVTPKQPTMVHGRHSIIILIIIDGFMVENIYLGYENGLSDKHRSPQRYK